MKLGQQIPRRVAATGCRQARRVHRRQISLTLKGVTTMSTSTATTPSGREERMPSTSELAALMFSEFHPHHSQEKMPLSYVHIPSNQNGSSSGTSEISSITRLAYAAATTCGSPPTSMGDVSYSMFSSSLEDPPTLGPTINSTFRLEPKFGPNTKLRSNPPFWSSSSNTPGIRGRKRTAQSMTLNNSNSTAITRSALVGRTQRRAHPDSQSHQPPSNVRQNHAITPASPRYVDSALFNLQGLSLRSPASTTSGADYNAATDYRTMTNGNVYMASPAATQSSFTACGSSSFSKVNTSFTSTATIDGTSPFRTYRSGSFGSTLEHPGTVDMIYDGMPPPASIEITSSSPRIVPLTVLTHDSVPTLQALSSAECHRRNLSFGSTGTGARPPTQHAFALGMSPLLLSVGSSSTSDDCRSGAVPATALPTNSDNINDIFRDDHHLMTRTPQRSCPPCSLVQYCPDSTHTTMSILADSPSAAFVDQKSTPSTATFKYGNRATTSSSAAGLPLPKVSLTPRSGLTLGNITSGLPSFPSPNSTSDDYHDMTIVLPNTSSRLNKSIRIHQSSTIPSRDVSMLTDTGLTDTGDNETCSLDLSVDQTSVIKGNVIVANQAGPIGVDADTKSPIKMRKSCHIGKRSQTKTNISGSLTPGACSSIRKNEFERLSLTMTSTPSAVSNVSIKEMVIEMGANRLSASNRRDSEVDTESLSDGDDDEFFLAVPSSLVEQELSETGRGTVRQSKQPRLLQTDVSAQVINGSNFNAIRNLASMTSFGSQNTLLGTGYAMSNTSLRGMDASSNQIGMSANFHGQHRSSLIFSECTGTSVNGGTMERVASMASIGLDLDQPSERPSGRGNAPFVNRDLVTPPVMLEPLQPPPLSPRFGSRKSDVWMNTTVDKMAIEAGASAPKDQPYYDSTKRTIA